MSRSLDSGRARRGFIILAAAAAAPTAWFVLSARLAPPHDGLGPSSSAAADSTGAGSQLNVELRTAGREAPPEPVLRPSRLPDASTEELGPCDADPRRGPRHAGVPFVPSDLPPFDHANASDQGLHERALANDGYAQQEYATRLQLDLVAELTRGHLDNPAEWDRWEQQFESMRDMFIRAIANGSHTSARRLGEALFLLSPKRDPVEGAAWLRLETRMGGRGVEQLLRSGVLTVTDDEWTASGLLAEQYIAQYRLAVLGPDSERVDTQGELVACSSACVGIDAAGGGSLAREAPCATTGR